jgi:hypothetical protein
VNLLAALAAALLIGLASAATWRVLAVDVITKRIRERLWGEDAPDTTFRQWLKAWGKCPWCAGAWVTALITLIADLTVDGGLPMPLLVFGAARYVTGWIGSQDEDYHEQTMKGEA